MRTYIKSKIREIDSWYKGIPYNEIPWLEIYDRCRSLLAEVELKASNAGLPAAVAACQVRDKTITVQKARRILAECLAACPVEPNDTLTPPAIARELSVSRDTVLGWIRNKLLPAANISQGKKRPRWIVKRNDLEAFLAKRQPDKPVTRKPKPQLLVQKY